MSVVLDAVPGLIGGIILATHLLLVTHVIPMTYLNYIAVLHVIGMVVALLCKPREHWGFKGRLASRSDPGTDAEVVSEQTLAPIMEDQDFVDDTDSTVDEADQQDEDAHQQTGFKRKGVQECPEVVDQMHETAPRGSKRRRL